MWKSVKSGMRQTYVHGFLERRGVWCQRGRLERLERWSNVIKDIVISGKIAIGGCVYDIIH